MEKRRVAITGLGVVAPNGIGLPEFWNANENGRSGIGYISSFDTTHFHTKIAGEVTNLDPDDYMPKKTAKSVDRFVHLGLAAAQMALDDSGLDLEIEDRERIGVIIGSGLGGTLFHEEQMMLCLQRGAHLAFARCVERKLRHLGSAQRLVGAEPRGKIGFRLGVDAEARLVELVSDQLGRAALVGVARKSRGGRMSFEELAQGRVGTQRAGFLPERLHIRRFRNARPDALFQEQAQGRTHLGLIVGDQDAAHRDSLSESLATLDDRRESTLGFTC